jgi:hypothetical protein
MLVIWVIVKQEAKRNETQQKRNETKKTSINKKTKHDLSLGL